MLYVPNREPPNLPDPRDGRGTSQEEDPPRGLFDLWRRDVTEQAGCLMADETEGVEARIDSVPGLRTALEIVGHANQAAHDDGRCVIEFERTESGAVNIQDITQHVTVLEGVNELLLQDDDEGD